MGPARNAAQVIPHTLYRIIILILDVFRSYREAKLMGGMGSGEQVLELYNLEKDPEERNNVANIRQSVVLRLKNIALNYYR